MIPRYSRQKISQIWSLENKFSIWLEIECLVAEKLAIDGIIPENAAKDIKNNGRFNLAEIEEIEKKTKHDFISFVENVSKYIGNSAKYFHHGLTSSDVIDTAFSIQLKNSIDIIVSSLNELLNIIKTRAIEHKFTNMMGRSHGVHAEPITFGLKLASFYAEFKRNLKRLQLAKQEISICSISGPVGTYNSINPEIEKYVAQKLNLKTEIVSTQIIPRDRHAFYFAILGILGSSIERLAVEIRNLQRTEILEVEESFGLTQKGSSAMPHKKNPILSENLTGLARYIRSGITPSLENIALWHERDISHSSVERIIAPDISIVADFSISRLCSLIKNLKINSNNMKNNIQKLNGLHYSQVVLLALVQKGLSREEAYKEIQSCAMKVWDTNQKFDQILEKNLIITKYISKEELKKIFSETYASHIDEIFNKTFEETD